MRAAIAFVAAAVAVSPGCGAASSAPHQAAEASAARGDKIDVAPAFEAGRSYTVITETGTRLDNPTTGAAEFRVTVESSRQIERGGVYGRSPLSWLETVHRVKVSGEHEWDSASQEPVPDDIVGLAALVDSKYGVDIAARGGVTIRDLELPMSRIGDEAKSAMKKKLGDLETIARGLASSVSKSLSAMPHRETHPGESWTHEDANPSIAADAKVTTTWTFEALDGGVATFRVTGKYQSQALKSGRITGRATFDVEQRLYREIDLETELVFAGKGGTVVTTQKVLVTPR